MNFEVSINCAEREIERLEREIAVREHEIALVCDLNAAWAKEDVRTFTAEIKKWNRRIHELRNDILQWWKKILNSKQDSETGIIKFFNSEKGFGFIKDDKTGKDVFVHFSKIITTDDAQGFPQKGQKVTFDSETDSKDDSKLRAVRVRVVKD